jgi:DNA polymerase-4
MRDITHLDIPDFYATLEMLRHPELKKRPLVLAEPGPRAVVQGVNGVARSEGIHEGMALGLARRLCRRLMHLPPDSRFYREQHERVLEELERFSPRVEGTFPGHYFVDLTGTRRLWGPGTDAACRVERALADRRALVARTGLGPNKLVSQVAAHCVAPGDLSVVFPGAEASFLAPLPVTFLPGVGLKTSARLSDFNIQRIGQLAALPAKALRGVFGKTGPRLLRLARGVDITPVVPFNKEARLSFVRQLERDEIDRGRLHAILLQQAEEAGWTLRFLNRYPGAFTLEVRYADGKTVQAQHGLPPIAAHVDQRLFRVLQTAFSRLVQRRVAVRRIVTEFSNFSMPLRQMSLFSWEERSRGADRRIQTALDQVRRRFGREALSWGRVAMFQTAPRKQEAVWMSY